MKRIFLFLATNIAILVVLSIILNLLGVDRVLDEQGVDLDYGNLLVFAALVDPEAVATVHADVAGSVPEELVLGGLLEGRGQGHPLTLADQLEGRRLTGVDPADATRELGRIVHIAAVYGEDEGAAPSTSTSTTTSSSTSSSSTSTAAPSTTSTTVPSTMYCSPPEQPTSASSIHHIREI